MKNNKKSKNGIYIYYLISSFMGYFLPRPTSFYKSHKPKTCFINRTNKVRQFYTHIVQRSFTNSQMGKILINL